jgi:hypothetical protein
MEPPPRPTSYTTGSRRGTASPQSSQSESAQDTLRRSSSLDLQQDRPASIPDVLPSTVPIPEESLQEPSIGEQYPPESSLSSLHDITALAMSRHQSGSRPQPDRNPSIQLLSPESARNPRRMSQVSPGFIFVIFPLSPRCASQPILSLSPYISFVIFPSSSFLLSFPFVRLIFSFRHLLIRLLERQRAAHQFSQDP